MYVLGIETSCDETSAAVVKDGRKILSNVVSSSLKFHKKYGGVVPEIASRLCLETISFVTDDALGQAGVSLKDIGLVSVTSGPGLLGSLLVGVSFAKSLYLALGVPLLGVDHIQSHVYANFLNGRPIKLPFIALVVSGGHTSLFFVEDFGRIRTLGETQDDACGEAFDKVAKILGLGYPGGPLIEKLARSGNPKKIRFRCSETGRELDFSFSGIKTAVLYAVRGRRLTLQEKRDIAASFQESAIGALIRKAHLACRLKRTPRLVIGGGVVANSRLRERFYAESKKAGIDCYFPASDLCTDNAAMVAGFGHALFKRGQRSGLYLTAGAG
ncbi:MAG: tRNA (adenosine(37)-N6)-threonylcarbamoyltransferase complex transferase subunit TsaD [Candidatus Omnitrophica bacterium]|nr:tRNA (adenosine(37)-N6)-threonylcarbamoyltransferase complex transferase subunit TsaD [Candidatus Omnitrophota bacterium]